MYLVDLAGSEKFDESFKDEGGKINASLLALGKVSWQASFKTSGTRRQMPPLTYFRECTASEPPAL